eukprot:TRINITY_DN6946_c0_g1_i2.p1 TRINITY_DN6946_c0_g1~~TRINITY_DN6946_c0_g1_i2.p1  ORF type:complete len:638 (+),score=140.47 TRINITY_DN6946_c0_g1_i2:69-1982(+)
MGSIQNVFFCGIQSREYTTETEFNNVPYSRLKEHRLTIERDGTQKEFVFCMYLNVTRRYQLSSKIFDLNLKDDRVKVVLYKENEDDRIQMRIQCDKGDAPKLYGHLMAIKNNTAVFIPEFFKLPFHDEKKMSTSPPGPLQSFLKGSPRKPPLAVSPSSAPARKSHGQKIFELGLQKIKQDPKIAGTKRPSSSTSTTPMKSENKAPKRLKLEMRDDIATQEVPSQSDVVRSKYFSSSQPDRWNSSSSTTKQSTLPEYFKRAAGSSNGSSGSSYHGFQNLGNTCYINAVLQCITSWKLFTRDLRSPKLSKSQIEKAALYRSLVQVVDEVSRLDHGVINPQKIKDSLGKTSHQFAGYKQQDAHEFLCFCLSQLETEIAALFKSEPKSPVDEDTLISKETASLCPINRNFNCIIEHTITCTNCNDVSTLKQLYRDFSLMLPESGAAEPLSIQDLFRQFFVTDEVEKKCKCGHDRAEASHRIVSLPRVLILHLKRFKPNFERQIYEKIADPVLNCKTLDVGFCCAGRTKEPLPFEFDAADIELKKAIDESRVDLLNSQDEMELALAESLKQQAIEEKRRRERESEDFGESSGRIPDTPDADASSPTTANVLYHLQSIVRHRGDTTNSGHYVADVFDPIATMW